MRENVYRLVYDAPRGLDGKRRLKTTTFHGPKKKAEAELARLIGQVEKGDYADADGMTVRELFTRYLSTAKPKLAAKTYERYADAVRTHIAPTLGAVKIDKLSPLHLEEAYAGWMQSGAVRRKGGLSARTVLHYHRLIRKVLGQGVLWKVLARNVADAVQPPRPQRREMTSLTAEQLVTLLSVAAKPPSRQAAVQHGVSCEPAWYPAILFLASTGVRRGECLAVKWDDLDLKAGVVSVRRSLEHTRAGLAFKSPKNGRPRVVEIPGSMVAALRRYRANQNEQKLALGKGYKDNGLVFARHDGEPMNPHAFGDAFRELVKRAGVPRIRLHDLRHTHATLLLQRGENLKVVSARLGHTTVGITGDLYAHVLPGMDRKAADAFDDLLKVTPDTGTELAC